MMEYRQGRALQLLRHGAGSTTATFRPDQEEAIRLVVEGAGRTLLVQKTGWGKSFVYFIATKLLREQGSGPALLVSPLLALMRNQIDAARRMGVRAVTINSDNVDEWHDVEALLQRDQVDALLISPERLANERFRTQVLSTVAARVVLLVIDEAHCISDWGHDFRPQYRLIERIVRTLPPNVRLLATTATANRRVMDDLTGVLGPDLRVLRGELSRDSLTLQTLRLPGQAERLAWLAEMVPAMPGSGIIYTLTKRDANLVAAWLASRGLSVAAYSSSSEHRAALEDALMNNELKALVATTALGMGFDKPDLSFVIHYQTPGSVVAYYQQVGRAGRAIHAAYGVLLSGDEDQSITNWFIESAFPTRDEVHRVLQALVAEPNGLSTPQLLGRLNMSKARIEKALQLLSLESPAPVVKDGTRWRRTASDLRAEFWQRTERLTTLRRREAAQMQGYVTLPFGQHMSYLLRALDADGGRIAEPRLPELRPTPCPELVTAAAVYLRRTSIPIEPRKQWPPGGLRHYAVTGSIHFDHQAQQGRALSTWGDAGWGKLVHSGKYVDGTFSDVLVDACARMIEEWNPRPAPSWVTCVPSLRHPELVPSFAQRLALALSLPFYPVLEKAGERPQQKEMANSVQQAGNVDGALALTRSAVPNGPVLLVDDVVDSRWTLTVAAWLLRRGGSGVVWPLALAQAGSG